MLTPRFVLSLICADMLLFAALCPIPIHPASIDFRATYIRIVDGDDFFGPGVDLVIEDATMSGDESTVIFYGRRSDTSEKKIYLVDAQWLEPHGYLVAGQS